MLSIHARGFQGIACDHGIRDVEMMLRDFC